MSPDSRLRAPETWFAAGLGGALAVAALVSPSTIATGPVVCPFRLLTGIPCPACGMTRSWAFAAHGDIAAAVAAHPVGPVAMAFAVVALVVLLERARSQRWLLPKPVMTLAFGILAVAVGVAGILRWVDMAT